MFSALEIFFGNALYEFTFYLLTYLLIARISLEKPLLQVARCRSRRWSFYCSVHLVWSEVLLS